VPTRSGGAAIAAVAPAGRSPVRTEETMSKAVERGIEHLVFWSRWLQAPLYLGLIAAQVLYCWKFAQALWHLLYEVTAPGEQKFMLGVLSLIDITMVANLITMVVIGGYATFVSKLDIGEHADRPDWLEHIDPGAIKVKLSASLIGVSGVHLLQSFISIDKMAPEHIKWQIIIHVTFLFSTILLALTELVMHRRHRAGEGHAGAAAPPPPAPGH